MKKTRNINRKKTRKNKMKTENKIGVEGAKMISEVMKSNSTLTSLNLGCEEEKQKEERR